MINDISGNPVVLTTSIGSANTNFVVDAVAPIAAVAPAGKPGATGANILANGVNAAEAANNIVIRAPLSSSAEVGDTVELFLATGTGASASFESPLTVVVDSTAAGSGVRYVEFSVAGVDLGVDGVKLLSTKTTDVARNIGVASPALKFVLDTAAPTDPTIALTDSGITTDFITNNKVVTVTHIAGADGGNEAATTIWEYTLDATAGVGDVGNLASSATSNGISFGAGSQVIQGVAGTTAETQTVALTGTATGTAAVNFLGVATASVASGATATAVGNAIVAAKAAIIAGAAGQAAGIADISNNAGTLTITYKATASWVRGTSSGLVSLPDDTYATGDFEVRRTDAAGNVSALVSNPENWTIDTAKPTFTTAAGTTINGAGHATIATVSEVGNAYLVNTLSITTPMTEAGIKALTAGTAAWNTAEITAVTPATDVLANGLTDGTYKLFVADVAGNLSSASTATITVDNILPTATALGVANSTTLRGTSSEAGSLVLVKADGSALTNAVTAGVFTASALTKTVTVAAQSAVTAATLKVLDTAGNEATATAAVILGTTGVDTLTSTAAKEFMFGFGDSDKFVFATDDVDTNGLVATDVIADFATGDKLIFGASPAGSAHISPVTGVSGVAETQTVVLSGTTAGAGVVNFLGVATASVASGANATVVGDAIVAAKAAIMAGTDGLAAGISNITNNAGTLTITYKVTAPGLGDVGPLASSATHNGISFAAGTEVIKGVNTVVAVSESGNYVEASAAVGALGTLLTDADAALAGTVKYYVGQVTGGSTYVVTDDNGVGYTNVIELVGVALSGIAFGDIVAS